MITTKEAAARLGISTQAVQRAIFRKTLPAEKIGRDWMIKDSAVEHYRQTHLRKPGRKTSESMRERGNKNVLRTMANRTARYGLPMAITLDDLEFCRKYWNQQCLVCRDKTLTRHLVFDHWIPLGRDECPGSIPCNIVLLCAKCNKEKNHDLPATWLDRNHPGEKERVLRAVTEYFESVRKAFIGNKELDSYLD